MNDSSRKLTRTESRELRRAENVLRTFPAHLRRLLAARHQAVLTVRKLSYRGALTTEQACRLWRLCAENDHVEKLRRN